MNFQILLETEQSVLRKNTIASLEHGSETDRHPNTPTHNQIDFLLCPSCFWCASYFNYSKVATRCPTCVGITLNLYQFQMMNCIRIAMTGIVE